MPDLIEISGTGEVDRHVSDRKGSIVMIIEPGNVMYCGKIHGLFGYRVGAKAVGLKRIIADFIRYESEMGRRPFVFIISGTSMNEQDPPFDMSGGYVVHSTDLRSGTQIRETGMLYSWKALRSKNIEFAEFGRGELGEPEDYRDLIDFGVMGHIAPEIVVASKQKGRFCREDETYTPGIRFYIPIDKITSSVNCISFLGRPTIRSSLDIASIGYRTVLGDSAHAWTPRAFTEYADRIIRSGDSCGGPDVA